MAQKRISDLEAVVAINGSEIIEVSQASDDVTISAVTISAAAADNSFNDAGGGFVAAGFAAGDRVMVAGFATGANNLIVGIVTALTGAKMTVGGTDGDPIVNEAAGASVTISKWISRRAAIQDIADLVEAASGAGTLTVKTEAAAYTAVLADAGKYILFTNATNVAFTIPPNSDVAFPIGTKLLVEQNAAGSVTFTAGSGVTLRSRGAVFATAGQYAVATALKVAVNTWTITGDIA